MKHLLISSLVLLPSFAVAQEESAPAADAPRMEAESAETNIQPKEYYSAYGEGRTLPEGVMRFRLPYRMVTSDSTYDKDGKKVTQPVDISVNAGAVVFEYGLTDRISLLARMDFYASQQAKWKSDADIRSSDVYKNDVAPGATAKKKTLIQGYAAALVAGGHPACTTQAACETALAAGLKAPQDTDFTQYGLPVTMPAGAPAQAFLEGAIDTAALAQVKQSGKDTTYAKKGATGIGDTEVGALYSILNENESPVAVSVGGGFRIPTGSKKFKSYEIPTTRFTTDLALRANVDYKIINGLYIMLQHQIEMMLAKGTYKIDGLPNQDYKREGIRNTGFVRSSWGLGNISQSLAVLGLYGAFNYDQEAKVKLGDANAADAQQKTFGTAGLVIDGLAYEIPAQLELEYEMPLSGKNGANALTKLGATLKAFYKF